MTYFQGLSGINLTKMMLEWFRYESSEVGPTYPVTLAFAKFLAKILKVEQPTLLLSKHLQIEFNKSSIGEMIS